MTAPGSRFRTHTDLRINHSERSDEHRRQDILLLLMIYFSEQDVNIVSWHALQRIWTVVLRKLEKKDLEVPGFYRDITMGRYRELDNLFFWLAGAGFGYYFLNGELELHLAISPRAGRVMKEQGETEEVRKVMEVAPEILRLYHIAKRKVR